MMPTKKTGAASSVRYECRDVVSRDVNQKTGAVSSVRYECREVVSRDVNQKHGASAQCSLCVQGGDQS